MLPIVVEKTVRLSGLDWEDQCIFSTQSEIGLFPTGEESLYAWLVGKRKSGCHMWTVSADDTDLILQSDQSGARVNSRLA